MATPEYILVTPAYNEAHNLPGLIRAVVSQDIKPQAWIIVDDGSEDTTSEVIEEAACGNDFIQHVILDRKAAGTYYASKVFAFNAGYRCLKNLGVSYDFIGNLDADISMPDDYYANVLKEFGKNPRLGVAGGLYMYENQTRKPKLPANMVPGSILMARRECFEDVGGYRPLKYGAEDTLFCITARSMGWETSLFPEYVVVQRREVGITDNTSMVRARFRQGLSEYDIGYHPLFELIRALKCAVMEKPYVIGSLARYSGYVCGPLYVDRGMVPRKAIKQLRREQIGRLCNWNRIKHKPNMRAN